MVDDSRTDKFTWKAGDLEEIKIFYVWEDPNFGWVWAPHETSADHDESGEHSEEINSIDKEFLGIPVSKLRNGAYDQHGNFIEHDDPILA